MIIGIDLGTTNSLVAVWRDGVTALIPNALGSVLTPSAVSVDAEDRILVGQPARDRLVSAPQHSIAAFKRYMGTNREFRLGRRLFRAEDLSALVLGQLKADPEAQLGQKVSEAVVTVPAYGLQEPGPSARSWCWIWAAAPSTCRSSKCSMA